MSIVTRRVLASVMSIALALSMCPLLPAIANGGVTPQAYAEGEQTQLADGTYSATGLTTAVLSMYHFDADTARVVVKGDDAWLITMIDGAEEPTTLNRFDGMAYGKQSEILDENDATHQTLVQGTPTAQVVEAFADDGTTVTTRTFVLPVPKQVVAANADIYYMIKYRAGYSATHDGDWYKASGGDYYLTGYTLAKVSDSTALPSDEPATQTVELDITNNTGMFKAVTASAEVAGDGSAVLTMALSGTGYHWLYKGTYATALAASDAIDAGIQSDTGSDKLIKGYLNDDNKWEFQIPIAAGETYVPCVALSQREVENYLAGTTTLARSFYPRQFEIDLGNATLVTGDYDETTQFSVSSNVGDFVVDPVAETRIVGGPNSNNYSMTATLDMKDATYSSVTYPTVVSGKLSEATAELTDGKFTISMTNAPKVEAFEDKQPVAMRFHVADDAEFEEAGEDVVRNVTFDQMAKTITINGEELTAISEDGYKAGEYIVGVQSQKADGTAYSMFAPSYNGVKGTALVTVDADGNATINYCNERNTYSAIYLGTLESGSTAGCLNQLPTEEQKASSNYIEATVPEGNSSWREFTYPFDINTLGMDAPYVTVSRSSGKFNASQLKLVFDATMTSKAAYDVMSLIDALPAAADVTVLDKDAIEAARAAYDGLSKANKRQVSNYDKLLAAEEAFANLPEKSEDTIAAEAMINGLVQNHVDVTDDAAAAVTAAREAYNALSPQQKAYVDSAVYQKLTRAEACVAFATAGISEGWLVDVGVDTSEGTFVAATLSPRSNAAYVYLYSEISEYPASANFTLKSGTVTKSATFNVVGGGTVLKGLWMVQTDQGQGREFTITATDANGNAKDFALKVPSVYGPMAEGTYDVQAIQTPSSQMRKFKSSVISSTGEAMTASFTMPNTSYDKIFLGTKAQAEAATDGFIEPSDTVAVESSTGTGNVYTIPIESMYQPITLCYHAAKSGNWTQETIKFVVDEQTQAVVDAVAALGLNTYFNVTAAQREDVLAAQALYEQLDENQKALMGNSNGRTLKNVVPMFVVADRVNAEIEALPAAADLTADNYGAVFQAKKDFDGMGHTEEVPNLQNSQLEKLIDQALRDKLNANLAAIAQDLATQIAALPDAESVTAESGAPVDGIEALLEALKDSNSKCSTPNSSLVNGLTKAEAAIVTDELLTKLAAVSEAYNAIPEVATAKADAAIQAAQDALAAVEPAAAEASTAAETAANAKAALDAIETAGDEQVAAAEAYAEAAATAVEKAQAAKQAADAAKEAATTAQQKAVTEEQAATAATLVADADAAVSNAANQVSAAEAAATDAEAAVATAKNDRAEADIAAASAAAAAAQTAADEAAQAATDAAAAKAKADEAAKTPGAAAVEAAKAAEAAAKTAAEKAQAAKTAAAAAKDAADKAAAAAVTDEQKAAAGKLVEDAGKAVAAADAAASNAEAAATAASQATKDAEAAKKAAEEAAAGQGGKTATKPAAAANKPLAKGKKFTVAKTTYKVNGNKTVTLVKSKTAKKSMTVNTVKYKGFTYKVTQVGKQAFKSAKKLAKLTLGKNVKKLAAKAFKGAKKLKTITVKSKKLTKKSAVKNCLKGSKVKTVKVKAAKSKTKKAFKKYAGKSKKCKVK